MKEELEKALYEDFPDLFKQHKWDATKTCMCWGCAVGDGWEPIIREMAEVLDSQGRNRFSARIRGYEWLDSLKVKLHNICRKIERKLGIPYGKLYQVKHRSYGSFAGWHVQLSQVKEKFGTLRVYYDIVTDYEEKDVKHLDQKDIEASYNRFIGGVNMAINIAERRSEKTCEQCGKPGKLTPGGWIKCLCENCIRK